MRALTLGICLVMMGAVCLWPAIAFLPLDPMVGDVSINQPNFRLHIPLTACITSSVALTLFFWYMRK